MTNTVVGGAVVEITMDLAKFGSAAKSDIEKSLSSGELKSSINKGLDDAASGAGQAGEKAGKAAGEGMTSGVKSESSNVTAATTKSAEDAGKSAESTFGKYGSSAADKFTGAAKLALLGGGLAIAGGIAAVLKTGIDEQSDYLKGQGQLAAGIKSTGNAAGTSVDHLEDLASSIQNYSGQTDDSIVASEQLLLTFTGIKNAAGPTNDILDQTVKISADMAARMGGDASSSAIQLGKALNDPVAGIAALSRVGVTFDDTQKKLIQHLVDTGNTAGAQKVILAELNKEFGGSAEAAGKTLPGQLARGKRAFEDVSQSVVNALMPVLVNLGTFLSNDIMPTFSKVVNFLVSSLGPVFTWIGHAIQVFVEGFTGSGGVVNGIAQKWITVFVLFGYYARQVFNEVANIVMNVLWPALKTAFDWVIAHWPQIQKVFVMLWQTVQPLLKALGNLFLTIWHTIWEPLIAWVKAHWSQISMVLEIVAIAIGVAFKVLAVVLTVAINVITDVIKVAVPIIVAIIQNVINVVETVASVIMWLYNDVIKPYFDLWMAITTATVDFVVAAFEAVVSFFANLPGRISSIASTVFDSVKNAATAARDWVGDKISDIVQFFIGLPARIATFASGAFDSLGSAASSGVKAALNGIIGLLNDAIGFINDKLISTANKVPFTNIPKIPPVPQLKAAGGWITGEGGPTSDKVPVMASPGEFMVRARVASRNRRLLETINGGGSASSAVASSGDGRPIEIHEHIYQQPNQDPASLAADTSRRVARSIRQAA